MLLVVVTLPLMISPALAEPSPLGVDFKHLKFFSGASFDNLTLSDCSFVWIWVVNCTFSYVLLNNCSFIWIWLIDSSFETITLNNCSFIWMWVLNCSSPKCRG